MFSPLLPHCDANIGVANAPTRSSQPWGLHMRTLFRALCSLLLVAPLVIGLSPGPATALEGTVQSTVSPMGQTNGQVDALAYADGAVYAAGSFTSVRPSGNAAGVGEHPRQGLAAFNSSTGAILSFNHTFNGAVKTIAVSPTGSRIYVGGAFTTVDGQARTRLAAFETATGALAANWRPSAASTVNALGVGPDGSVYLGGSFGTINSTSRLRLGAVRGDTGVLLPWNASAGAATYSIAVAGGKVFVGGTFESLNGDTTIRAVGTLDAVTGATVPFPAGSVMPARTPACYSVIRDIVVSGGIAYFGAEGTGGGCMDGTFAANVSDGSLKWVNHCLGATQAVEVVGGWLYKGSHAHDCRSQVPDDPDGFPQVEKGQGRHLLVQSLGTGHLGPWYPNTSGDPLGPRAMATDGTQLFVAGDFLSVNNRAQQGVARFLIRPGHHPAAQAGRPCRGQWWARSGQRLRHGPCRPGRHRPHGASVPRRGERPDRLGRRALAVLAAPDRPLLRSRTRGGLDPHLPGGRDREVRQQQECPVEAGNRDGGELVVVVVRQCRLRRQSVDVLATR
jgi:hypothetical protein